MNKESLKNSIDIISKVLSEYTSKQLILLRVRTTSSNMSRCKCPKSDIKPVEECSPYFENITTRMEERRCDLIGRQKYLRNKITTMERSIPALIAYNMCMSKEKCTDAPYCKIREIMKTFAPYPDQTERLLHGLKKTVKQLNGETTELHEKIIQADVKLEETGMELESLELVNKEMRDRLISLEKEVKSYVNPSLHSIHSNDLICLSKMRQLAEEELCLKNCIRDLETKETLFKEHMDRLLTSREYQNACGRRKISSCLQDLDCRSKRPCPQPKKCTWNKPNDQRPRKKPVEDNNVVGAQTDPIVIISKPNVKNKQDQGVMSEVTSDKVEKKSSWMPNWWAGNDNPEEAPPSQNEEAAALPKTNNELMPNNEEATETDNEKSPTIEASTQALSPEKEGKGKKVSIDKPPSSQPRKTSSCKPCGLGACPPDSPTDRPSRKKRLCAGKLKSPCEFTCDKLIKALSKCADPTMMKAIRELPHTGRDQYKQFPPSYEFESPCEICPSPRYNNSRPSGNNCRCNCSGKCARKMSDDECNCSQVLMDLDRQEQYQSRGPKRFTENFSDDEYCECCSCGCEDSDVSSCLCN